MTFRKIKILLSVVIATKKFGERGTQCIQAKRQMPYIGYSPLGTY